MVGKYRNYAEKIYQRILKRAFICFRWSVDEIYERLVERYRHSHNCQCENKDYAADGTYIC